MDIITTRNKNTSIFSTPAPPSLSLLYGVIFFYLFQVGNFANRDTISYSKLSGKMSHYTGCCLILSDSITRLMQIRMDLDLRPFSSEPGLGCFMAPPPSLSTS